MGWEVAYLNLEDVMNTTKKELDDHARQTCNLIGLPNSMGPVSGKSAIDEISRKEDSRQNRLPNDKIQTRIGLSPREHRLLPLEVRSMGPLTIMVADDHPVVREGLVAMIERQSNMQVVAQAGNGREAIDKFLARKPDVGLLDLRMPLMNGIDAVAEICDKEPGARLIILSTYQGQEDIYRALRAGALGYLLKDAPVEDLVESIWAVSAGMKWIPPAVGAMLAKRVTDRELTAREMEVLRVLALGKSNKEIGVAFNISEATVKVHVTHILEKLKVTGRTEAINVAVRRGLVTMDSAAAA
jgi:two-component system, NarL family, response regulator